MSVLARAGVGHVSLFGGADATVPYVTTLASSGTKTSGLIPVNYGGGGMSLYVYVGYDTGTASDYTITYTASPITAQSASTGAPVARLMPDNSTSVTATVSPAVVTAQTGAHKVWKVYSISPPAASALTFSVVNNQAVTATAHAANATGLSAYLVWGG